MSCCARETPNAAQKILRSPRLFLSSPEKDDKGLKFGLHLQELSNDNQLPTRLKLLLDVLYEHAPNHVHVFGLQPHVSDCLELKSKLERSTRIPWHGYYIYLQATVFLNFLQCLPSPLLMNEIFHEWMEVTNSRSVLATKAKLMRLCKSLPELNQQLLKHVLLILRRVCKNAPFTHTTPILAGHFVGPSLLWRPSSQFVAYPSENVHRTLAKLVKCLILFLDDIWNDLNEEEMFPTLKPQAPRDDSGTQKPSDAFVGRSVPAYVDEMEQESRRNNRIRDVLQTSQEYASFELLPASSSKGNKVQASCPRSNPSGLQPRLNSRSVHTWPGCGKAKVGQTDLDKSEFNDTLLATGAGAVDRSKTATFPRCTPGAMLEDAESAFPSFGEDYLYPDWAFLYPEWDLSGDTLPGWATRSCFTLDLNSLAEQTTRKWIGINTQLFNKVSNLPVSEDGPFRHSELPGTKL